MQRQTPNEIRIIGLSYNNCLFNADYVKAYAQNKDAGLVITHNRAFLEQLRSENESFNKAIIVSTSNRTSIPMDMRQSIVESTSPMLIAELLITHHLNCHLNKMLMADVYSFRKDDTTFEAGFQMLDDKASGYDYTKFPGIHLQECPLDPSKISIVYAQMNKSAMQYPHDNITFDIYDGNPATLAILQKFYQTYPQLIPANVKLRLHHYKGQSINRTLQQQQITLTDIQGAGIIDVNYACTIVDICRKTGLIDRQKLKAGLPANIQYVYKIAAETLDPKTLTTRLSYSPENIAAVAANTKRIRNDIEIESECFGAASLRHMDVLSGVLSDSLYQKCQVVKKFYESAIQKCGNPQNSHSSSPLFYLLVQLNSINVQLKTLQDIIAILHAQHLAKAASMGAGISKFNDDVTELMTAIIGVPTENFANYLKTEQVRLVLAKHNLPAIKKLLDAMDNIKSEELIGLIPLPLSPEQMSYLSKLNRGALHAQNKPVRHSELPGNLATTSTSTPAAAAAAPTASTAVVTPVAVKPAAIAAPAPVVAAPVPPTPTVLKPAVVPPVVAPVQPVAQPAATQPAAAQPKQSPAARKKLHVTSLDFDGCGFSSDCKALYKENKDPNLVITTTQAFLDNLKAENKLYDNAKMFVGSNRQNIVVDSNMMGVSHYSGARPAITTSCFAATQRISRYLNIPLDKFLMPDLFNGLPTGSTFDHALSVTDPQTDLYDFSRFDMATVPDCGLDKNKISLLYAQIQKTAMEHPDEDITFDFADDTDEILNGLLRFFTDNPDLLPSNVTLRLFKYARNILSREASYIDYSVMRVCSLTLTDIKGTGMIDANYAQTVMDIATSTITKAVRNANNAITKIIEYQSLNVDVTKLTHRVSYTSATAAVNTPAAAAAPVATSARADAAVDYLANLSTTMGTLFATSNPAGPSASGPTANHASSPRSGNQ